MNFVLSGLMKSLTVPSSTWHEALYHADKRGFPNVWQYAVAEGQILSGDDAERLAAIFSNVRAEHLDKLQSFLEGAGAIEVLDLNHRFLG